MNDCIIDWNERLYELTKHIVAGMCANPNSEPLGKPGADTAYAYSRRATAAVELARHTIAELRKNYRTNY